MRDTQFNIDAHWQRRQETPLELAERIRTYFRYARAHIPDDLDWYFDGDRLDALLGTDAGTAKIAQSIFDHAMTDDDGKSIPHWGYSKTIQLGHLDPSARYWGYPENDLKAGAASSDSWFGFSTDPYFKDNTDPRLITYDCMRAHMMSIVWAFQPEYCTAGPGCLQDYLDYEVYVRPAIGLAWMTWIDAALAKQIELPHPSSQVIVEQYPDGSLFMANSKETFSVDNSSHLRGARAIHRQIDPLNYLVPFEGMCGRNPRVPPFPKVAPPTFGGLDGEH